MNCNQNSGGFLPAPEWMPGTMQGTMPGINPGMIPVMQDPGPVICEGDVLGSSRFPVGMGYVPMQKWEQPYPLEYGFHRGTIFRSLDDPFVMRRCRV